MYRYCLIVIMVLLGGLRCAGQEDLRFYHIPTKGYRVKTIYRDDHNFLWVGSSYGLFTLPQLESRNPNGYNRQHPDMQTGIDGIFEAGDGWLWLITHHAKVIMYHPEHNEMNADVAGHLEKKGVKLDADKDFSIYIIKENGDCVVWQANRLYVLNQAGGEVKNISLDSGESIMKVEAGRSAVIVLTARNLYYFSKKTKEQLCRVPLGLEVKMTTHVAIDDDNNVWLSDDHIVQAYNYATRRWLTSAPFPSHVSAIECGPDGKIWIGQENDGIYICDKNMQVCQHLVRTAGDANGLKDNQIFMLHYEKYNGMMWVAYTKGDISVYDKNQNAGMLYQLMDRQNPNAMTDVIKFAETADGKGLWMGLEDRGIYYRDLSAVGWRQQFGSGSVISILSDAEGTLWTGLYKEGLQRMAQNGAKQVFFKGESPFAIIPGPEGQMFVALQGKGVWQLDAATGQESDLHCDAQYVFDLIYRDGQLHAIATTGYYVTDGSAWKAVCKGVFRHGCIDSRNYIYLLGEADRALSLTVLDPQGNMLDLPSELGKVPAKSAALDKYDNLWAVNGNKLVCLHHGEEEWEYKVFNINPASENVFYNPGAIQIDLSNRLWLGTDNGYQSIDLNMLSEQTRRKSGQQPLAIGCISINDEIVSPGQVLNGRVLLTDDVILTRQLELKYNENNIMVECSGSYGQLSMADTYYYQLRGLSDTWLPIENGAIILSNLPPGKYQLMTKAQNSLESRLLDITIAVPFWLSWWACLVYFVVAAILIAVLTRYFRNKRNYELKLQQLALEQEQTRQLNDIKLRFFTNISHDLRTPLSLIVGPVEDLEAKADEKDETTKSLLATIHRNADLLLSLVNQILDFRRLEFGNEKLMLSYGDLVPMIGDVCDTFRLKAKKEGITLKYEPRVECVETQFDKDKMTKIVMNLLSNAFKFTSEGGSITVGVDASDGQMVMTVADTGIGISDEEKPFVFDRFYQSDNNIHAIGCGIGLHIVREYVHLHGGDIAVEDNEGGKGAVFCLTLPLHESTEVTAQESQEEEDDAGMTSLTGSNHDTTVLVVDDNSDFLNYMSQSLSENYHVLSALDGKKALGLLQENDIDIIISDVMMDGIDGLQLCRLVKADITTSHIPVILLTAKAQSTNELEGLEAGADDYIVKPFKKNILLQRIHNLLERSRQLHQRFKNEIDIAPSEITVTSLDEQFISQAISLVEEHISDAGFNVEELSGAMGVHRSQLYKKLQHLTGRTPIQFIRLLRLKRGKQLLEQSGLYVSEIAYRVGFNSPRVFSKYFKAEFGTTPEEYKANNQL